MKYLLSVLMISVLLFANIYAGNSSATVTRQDKTENSVSYTFTATEGGTDSIIVDFGGFTYADYNIIPASIRFTSGETTLDSIRWYLYFQGKSYPGDTWFTFQTETCDSALSFIKTSVNAINGYWPYLRLLMVGNVAKNAEQAISGDAVFIKN